MCRFHGSPFLVALPRAVDKTLKGLLLLLERFGMTGDGLGGAIELLDGDPDLLVAQDTGFSEVSRHGQPISQAGFVKSGIPDGISRGLI